MVSRVFITPQVSFPTNINVSDCHPSIVNTDTTLANLYIAGSYIYRSAWSNLAKGPVPPPMILVPDVSGSTVGYEVYFNNFTGGSCPPQACNFQCLNQTVTFTDPSATTEINTYCLNGEIPLYRFTVEYSTEGDRESTPAEFSFSFEDSNGNSNTVSLYGLAGVKPLKPNAVMIDYNDSRNTTSQALIGINYITVGNAEIPLNHIESFSLERALGDNLATARIIINKKKLEGHHDLLFYDKDAPSDKTLSYRTKLHTIYGEDTQWSDWSTINQSGTADSTITWTP
jgi:hypothetical protein